MGTIKRSVGLAAALALLNASLTFYNVWPTPAIRWQGELSLDLVVCLVALVAARRLVGPPTRRASMALALFWVLLILGRYGEVTAAALYGRDINLFWDVRYVSDVAAMLTSAASVRLAALAVAGAAAVVILLYAAMRWAFGRVSAAIADTRDRRALEVVAAAASIVFLSQQMTGGSPAVPAFSKPVTATYGRQAMLLAQALAAKAGASTLPPSPSAESNLGAVAGADVILVFLESYGAATYDRAEFSERLERSRVELESAARATERDVVSAFVESPTFGGSSWFAHLSLISGIEVRDPETYGLLMTEDRETLVTTFTRHDYRTIALMPGLHQKWPEGAFYRFEDIYDLHRLEYHAWGWGWFAIPDQFSLARLHQLELAASNRRPVFVFFPTISTHWPFSPTAPYQPDWQRILTARPYDDADIERASVPPDWFNLGPSYVKAVAYAYESLAGFLQRPASRDFVMIVIGDHQPPAGVSGEGASWDVPVHVITSRRARSEERRVGKECRL